MGAKERLLKYIDYKDIKKSDFYKSTGLSNGFLDKNLNISSDKIEIIISAFPDLSLNWLVTGQGEMLRYNEEKNISKSTKNIVKQTSSNEFPKIAAERYQGYNAPVEKVPQFAKNIFTGDTDKEIDDFIADAFAQHLLEMYETGRVYPAAVVKSLLEEKNRRIRELEKEIKELDRKLDQVDRDHNIELKKDRH